MTQQNNNILNNKTVIYVDFKAQKANKVTSASTDPTPDEIHALFAPRFGSEFTAWFINQYKKLEA